MHVSLTCVKILYCWFFFFFFLRWGALLENLHYLENCVTWKIVTLKNCCTWKTVFSEKLRCFENCVTWRTDFVWKTELLWKTALLWKLALIENFALGCVTYWKICVGVRYLFKNFLNIIYNWKFTSKNCARRKLTWW